MKITEEAFSDFTGHMCRAGFTNSISDEPLTERQQSQLSACLQAVPFSPIRKHNPWLHRQFWLGKLFNLVQVLLWVRVPVHSPGSQPMIKLQPSTALD